MPLRKTTRLAKASKENAFVTENKLKSKVANPARKPLGDKTNSGSDDVESPLKTPVKVVDSIIAVRPRRMHRLPSKFAEFDHSISPNTQRSTVMRPIFASTPIIKAKKENGKVVTELTKNSRQVKGKIKRNNVNSASTENVEEHLKENIVAKRKLARPLRNKKQSTNNKENSKENIVPKRKPVRPLQNKTKSTYNDKENSKENIISKRKTTRQNKMTKLTYDNKDDSENSKHENNIEIRQLQVKISPLSKHLENNALSIKGLNRKVLQVGSGKPDKENELESLPKIRNNIFSGRLVNKPTTSKHETSTEISQLQVKISPLSKHLENNALSIKGLNGKVLQVETGKPEKDNELESSPKIRNKIFSGPLVNKQPQKDIEQNLNVYDFTFDPDEEPPPQKKKRTNKKMNKNKQPPKPKTFFLNNNYDKNLFKKLESLKNAVGKKTDNTKSNIKINETNKCANLNTQTKETVNNVATNTHIPDTPKIIIQNVETTQNEHINENIEKSPPHTIKTVSRAGTSVERTTPEASKSVRMSIEEGHAQTLDNFVYSPVPSPQTYDKKISKINETRDQVRTTLPRATKVLNNTDSSTLIEDLSFDDVPVASSSVIIANRHPEATPWRVHFEDLPIRWGVNTYLKPNMTPALDSSCINFDNEVKKHVYTNILPAVDEDDLPLFEDVEIVQHNKPTIKDFFKKKEVTIAPPASDDEQSDREPEQDRTDEDSDDCDRDSDETFRLPVIKTMRQRKKKPTKVQKIIDKKEDQELESWAEEFNSMCKDVDNYDLVVE